MNKSGIFFILAVLIFSTGLSRCTDDTDNDEDFEKQVFIAIHCEPGAFPKTTDYQNEKWLHLTKLVKSADDHGHEIGLHSHGPSQRNWNGYTNKIEFQDNPKYIGSISEMMLLVKKVSKNGMISTAAVTDNDQEQDYPKEIPYDVDGGWNGKDDLVSTPDKVTINGVERTQLRHARYSDDTGSGGEINVPLADLGKSVDDLKADQVIGIVFHAFDYADRPTDYDELFRYLDEDKNIRIKTVSSILD